MAQQQWLAAVQHDIYLIELVETSVFGYPGGRMPGDYLGQRLRLRTPALVGVLVNITVITRKITSAMYL
jgi:hypothetical protein